MKSNSPANSGKQFLVSAAVALVTGFAIPQAASATDDDVVTCGLKTLRGVYEFSASGFNIVNGAAVPKAIIETIVLDGRGGVLTPAVSVSVNGFLIQPPQGSPGVYTVDADCTGTLTFGDGPSFDLHIHPYGKSITMLQTFPVAVMQGTATRVLSLAQWRAQQ
jgi:hypothetical protein